MRENKKKDTALYQRYEHDFPSTLGTLSKIVKIQHNAN